MKYLVLLVFGVLVSCQNEGSDTRGFLDSNLGGSMATFSYSEVNDGLDVEEAIIEKSDYSGRQVAEITNTETEQKIIKTAGLSFETQDLEATHHHVLVVTKALNGFISTDNSGKNYSEHFHNVSVRIPTENFQKFIDDISEGVSFFDRKDISRRDVSEEFIDLSARLKAKKELEKRYLELLKQAKNVKEMLEIERELSSIREEIEAKQGRLNYLQDQVSMSTVNMRFYKFTNETGVTVSYGQKMKNAISGGWDGISVFFIGLLYLWPLFLIITLLILVLRRWIKRRKKRNAIKNNS